MLKIRFTPTDGEQKAQMREWATEKEATTFRTPAVPYERRNFQKMEGSQIAEPLCTNGTTLGNAPDAPFAPGTCKSTCENFGKPAKKYSDQLYL